MRHRAPRRALLARGLRSRRKASRSRLSGTPPEPGASEGFFVSLLFEVLLLSRLLPAGDPDPGDRASSQEACPEARGPPEGTARASLAVHQGRGGHLVRFGGALFKSESAATRFVFNFAALCGVQFQVVKDSVSSS